MNIDYSRSAYAKKDDVEENWWQRRSGLERRLIISCVVAVLFAIGCLLYISLGHSTPPQICTTATCLSAAAEIISHMDPDVDPCEDFYKFVCGKFNNEKYKSIQALYSQQLKDNVLRQLAEIIEEPVSEDDHYLVKSQKELLQACVHETGIEQAMGIFHETFLDEIGGWPVVKQFHWKPKFFEWTETVHLLRANGYPYSMILNVGMVYSINDPSENHIYITNPSVEVIADHHKDAYMNYMIDVAVAFGADRHRAEIELPEVLQFMEELEKIQSKNWEGPFQREKTTVKEYQERHDYIDWLDFINKILEPAATISSDDYVTFPTDEYMTALFALMETTFRRVQANYMIWAVLDNVIPHMSSHLKELKWNYICQTKKKLVNQNRMEFCKSVIDERPLKILYARKNLPIDKREQVEQLYGNIKAEFLTILSETPWMDKEDVENATGKLEAIFEIIGTPGDYFNDTIFDDLEYPDYAEEINSNHSFFSMLLRRSRRKYDLLYSMLGMTSNYTSFIEWVTNIHVTHLNIIANVIVVPVGFIQDIYYNDDRPMYLNYAAMGTVIGSKLAQGFCDDQNDMWSEESANALKNQSDCFSKDARYFSYENVDQMNLIAPDLHHHTSRLLEQTVADYAGVKIAYRAYTQWVKDNEEEAQLIGTEYTPSQLFWISAMSFNCFTFSDGDSSMFRALQASQPFRNNPEFANDFNCAVDSAMNPSEKCEIF